MGSSEKQAQSHVSLGLIPGQKSRKIVIVAIPSRSAPQWPSWRQFPPPSCKCSPVELLHPKHSSGASSGEPPASHTSQPTLGAGGCPRTVGPDPHSSPWDEPGVTTNNPSFYLFWSISKRFLWRKLVHIIDSSSKAGFLGVAWTSTQKLAHNYILDRRPFLSLIIQTPKVLEWRTGALS